MLKFFLPSARALPTRLFFNNTVLNSLSINSKQPVSRVFSSNILQSSFIGFGRRSLTSSFRTSRSRNWQNYNRYYGNTPWNKLKSPAIFTLLFCSGTTLLTPYLFDYTPVSVFKRKPYALILSIIALNGGVFLLWRAPQFSRVLNKYFLITKDNVSSNWSFLGAAFSHQSFAHFAVNMFVLHSFGTTLCTMLGSANFTIMYLNSAVIASFISLAIPVLTRSNLAVGALGASGAIFSVFGTFSYLIPKAPIALFFFPIPGGAWFAFLGAAAYNIAGIVFKFGRYDYAAHIGGSIAGVAYGWWYDRKRKQNRRVRTIIY